MFCLLPKLARHSLNDRAGFLACALLLLAACEASESGAGSGGELSEARRDAAQSAAQDAGTSTTSTHVRAVAKMIQIRPRALVNVQTDEYTDVSLPTAGWPIVGTATFKATSEGIDLSLEFEQCRGGYAYPIAIYDSASCAEVVRGSEPWRDGGSEGVRPAGCLGAPGGFGYHTRASTADHPWTLGGSEKTNLVGRTIAVLDPDSREPLACGRIEGVVAPERGDTAALRVDTVAQLASLCLLGKGAAARDDSDPRGICPDPNKVARCGVMHCGVSECLTSCAEYVACIESADESCSVECAPSEECVRCLPSPHCMLGFCAEELTCVAPPTPGGPCTELEACCMRQGPLVSSCLMQVRQLAQLGGDPTCIGTLNDFDFNTNFAFRSPCYQDDPP